MRTFKFRAKRKDNGQWAYGSLVITPHATYIYRYEDSTHIVNEINPDTVCQFTGFHDENSTEVYEHDIIECIDGNSEVVWMNGFSGFYSKGRFSKEPLAVAMAGYVFRVIGNTFDYVKYNIKKIDNI